MISKFEEAAFSSNKEQRILVEACTANYRAQIDMDQTAMDQIILSQPWSDLTYRRLCASKCLAKRDP